MSQISNKPREQTRTTFIYISTEHGVFVRPGGARAAVQPPAVRGHTRAARRGKLSARFYFIIFGFLTLNIGVLFL